MGNGKGQAGELTDEGKQLFRESSPLRQLLLSQATETAATGGVPGSKVPVIQRAVEAQRQAQSQGLRSAQDQLSGAGIADSSWGQGIMANIRGTSDQAIAAIPAQMSEQISGGAQNMAMGFPQIAGSNLGNAGQLMNAAKGGTKGKGCWVADVLFGEWDARTFRARNWVTTHPRNWFTRLYLRFGVRWAEWLRHRPRAQRVVRPLWLLLARLGAED